MDRKVYFYRINAGRTETGEPRVFDAARVLQHLNGLPFTTAGRYFEHESGRLLCAWVDRQDPPQRMRFATIRRSDLPHLEAEGELEPLDLPVATGLYEPVHLVFVAENLIGAEFNFYGPRVTTLASYLRAKAPDLLPELAIDHLLRRDASDQLDRLEDIRLFDLKVSTAYSQTLQAMDEDLGTALNTLGTIGQAQQVRLVLQPEPYSRRGTIAPRLLRLAKKITLRADVRENATIFKVKGHDQERDRVVEVDLLRDLLIADRRFLKMGERSRAVDPDSAYEQISAAYDELRDDLARAAAIGE